VIFLASPDLFLFSVCVFRKHPSFEAPLSGFSLIPFLLFFPPFHFLLFCCCMADFLNSAQIVLMFPPPLFFSSTPPSHFLGSPEWDVALSTSHTFPPPPPLFDLCLPPPKVVVSLPPPMFFLTDLFFFFFFRPISPFLIFTTVFAGLFSPTGWTNTRLPSSSLFPAPRSISQVFSDLSPPVFSSHAVRCWSGSFPPPLIFLFLTLVNFLHSLPSSLLRRRSPFCPRVPPCSSLFVLKSSLCEWGPTTHVFPHPGKAPHQPRGLVFSWSFSVGSMGFFGFLKDFRPPPYLFPLALPLWDFSFFRPSSPYDRLFLSEIDRTSVPFIGHGSPPYFPLPFFLGDRFSP